MNPTKRFGEHVRILRKAKGYNQEELAKLCSLKKAAISKLENGTPSKAVEWIIRKLGEIFGREFRFVDPATQRIATHLSQAGFTDIFENQEERKEVIQEDVRKSKDIRLLLVRGWRVLGDEDSLLGSILEENVPGRKIRVLLLNPQSRYVNITEEMLDYTPGNLRGGIRETIKVLKEAQKRTAASLEYRLYDDFPVWRLFFADDKVLVGSYLKFFKAETSMSSVHYRIVKKEPPFESLFFSFENYFEHLWNHRSGREKRRTK